MGVDRRLIKDAGPAGVRRPVMVAQDAVHGRSERRYDPALIPVLGDVAQATLPAGTYAGSRHLHAVQQDSAAGGWQKAGDAFNQLGLAVAFDAGDTQDLAGPDLQTEEHTSELQSRGHLVCRHLLEK